MKCGYVDPRVDANKEPCGEPVVTFTIAQKTGQQRRIFARCKRHSPPEGGPFIRVSEQEAVLFTVMDA